MKILITGGTGFIGRTLCQRLLAQGHELSVLSRQAPALVKRICGETVSPLGAIDALTPQASFDAVINLAGEPIAAKRWTEARKSRLWDSRVTLTARLVDFIAASERKPRVMISGSAVGFYGDRGDALLDEDSEGRGGFSHDLCAAWEEAARRVVEYGVRVCCLRTGLVVGAQGGFLQQLLPLFGRGLGGRIGTGRQWMSWIHLDDHVAMTLYLLEHDQLGGAFNATAPSPVTNSEFTQCLAGVLRRPAVLPVPAFALRLLFGDLSELLLGGQRVLPRRAQQEGFEFRYPQLEEALRQAVGA